MPLNEHPESRNSLDLGPGRGAGHNISVAVQQCSDRYRVALVKFFSRHTGNHFDAEDLAQEVFVRIAQQPGTLEVDHVEAYLFQIASNLLRDRFRRDQRHKQSQHLTIDAAAYEGEAPSTERVYEDRERLETFMQALAELPPKCRTVFFLQRYEGLSYAAIATRLGISVSAVEKHMMKALLHFNECLGPL